VNVRPPPASGLRPRTSGPARPGLTRLALTRPAALRLLLGILAPLLVVAYVGVRVLARERFPFELPLRFAIKGHATPALDWLAEALATVGGSDLIAPLSLALLGLLWWRARPWTAFFGASVAGSALLNLVLKVAFQPPEWSQGPSWERVLEQSKASFPSGHSTYSIAFALAVSLMLWRTRWRWPALGLGLVFTLLVGFSRLYLEVHYPGDVLCGWLSGLAWVLTCYGLLAPGRRGAGGIPTSSERAQ